MQVYNNFVGEMKMPFIKVENLVHKFFERNNEGEIIDEKNALDGVDFQIEA